MTCEHGRIGVVDGGEEIVIGHIDTVYYQPDTKKPPQITENKYEERVKYKDWKWRCKGCFPE